MSSASASTPAWACLPIIGLNNDDDYDVDARTPNAQGQLDAFRDRSDAVRNTPGMSLRTVSYADHPLAVADVFRPAQGPVRGTVVFLHGGYWKGTGRPNRAFLAPAWTAAGVQWINLGYPVAPGVTVPEICRFTRGALLALLRDQAPFEDVAGPVVLSGNSVGAHLLAHALTDAQVRQAAVGRLAGSMLLSGLYELEPLIHLPSREWTRLDTETAAQLSPLRYPAPSLPAPTLVAVGADEPPAFIGQSRAYAQHLLGRTEVGYQEVAGRNHMSLIPTLESPDAVLGRVIAGWLGLADIGR